MTRVAFVIPTKNEEETLAQVLKDIRKESSALGIAIEKIFVVDDSRDRTREIASKEEHVAIITGGGHGLGEAMFRGLKRAALTKADFIVSIDGDGQANLKELGQLLAPLQNGVADLVLSSRRLEKGSIKYTYPTINALGIYILVWLLRRGTGLPLTDSHGGLRGMIRPVAMELEMFGAHTYVQETIFDAFQKGYRIMEIPGEWLPRDGESRVLASIPRYIFTTLPVIIIRCRYHTTFLLPCFIILATLGVLTLGFSILSNIFPDNPLLNNTLPIMIIGGIGIILGVGGTGVMIILDVLLTALSRRHLYGVNEGNH